MTKYKNLFLLAETITHRTSITVIKDKLVLYAEFYVQVVIRSLLIRSFLIKKEQSRKRLTSAF